MKKIISLMLVAVMMVTCLTSCALVNELLTQIMKKQGTENEPSETRYTITAEEWEAMLNMKNYTAEASGTKVVTDGVNNQTETQTLMRKCTEDDTYMKTVDNDGTPYEYYYTEKDGKKYSVMVEDDGTAWADHESSWEESTFGDGIGLGLKVSFDDLTYNGEKKAYICTVSQYDMSIDYEFYFENGRVIKVIGTCSYYENTATVTESISLIIYNIGITVVKVPEFTIIYP